MLAKLLILVLIIALVYVLFKSKSRKNKTQKIELIECKKCGTFMEPNSLKNGICESCAKA